MKPLRDLLRKIHKWPDETRSVLAGILFFVSAIVVYNIWSADISHRLGELSEPAVMEETEIVFQKREETPSPVAGIRDSLHSVGQILPDIEKKDVASGLGAMAQAIENALDKLTNFIFP